MTYEKLKWFAIWLPVVIIGGFEYARHEFLLSYLSMEMGNLYITLLTLILSYLFVTWMFRHIKRINQRLAEEQARRAVYMERERLARELHDNIAQTLFFLNVAMKQGRKEEARAAVAKIDHDLRQAIFNLRSSPDEGAVFAHRVCKWLDEWSALSGIDVNSAIEVRENYFSPAEEILLFGIIQEAFTNIRKHSRARTASIALKTADDRWHLRIADDGQGMPPAEQERQTYGVAMMRERAEQLGGALQIRSGAQGGTELYLEAKRRKARE